MSIARALFQNSKTLHRISPFSQISVPADFVLFAVSIVAFLDGKSTSSDHINSFISNRLLSYNPIIGCFFLPLGWVVLHSTLLFLFNMPSTTASASEVTISSKPCRNEPRSQLIGQSPVKFEPCGRSDTRRSAGPSENGNNPPVVGGGNIDSNLLSPPLSVDNFDDPPFKAADSDQTSISMKHRRCRRARRHRCGLNHASTGDAEEQPATPRPIGRRLTSSSMPDLRHDMAWQRFPSAAGRLLMRQQMQAMHRACRRDSIARSVASKRRASLPKKPHRWTMPSKAASTRVLSELPTPAFTITLLSTKDQQQSPRAISAALGTSQQSLPFSSQAENKPAVVKGAETPAMITLKRATSKKGPSSAARRTSLRPNAIISFPPPKFTRTASTHFASFLGLNSPRFSAMNDEPIQTSVRQSSWSTGQDSEVPLRKASVTADRVQLTANALVAPALTQVEFFPLSHAHTDHQQLLVSARRCSTTIVSGNSVHEIIWDENITSSSEGSTSAELSKQPSKSAIKPESPDRSQRQPVLVEKLEAQLKNNNRRRASLSFQNLGTPNEADKPQQNPLPMDLKPDLNHDILPNVNGLFATLQGEDRLSPTAELVGFFPPLEGSAGNSQKSSFSREQSSPPDTKHVLMAKPSSTVLVSDSISSELVGKGKGKSRSTSVHPSQSRKSGSSDHHPSMGSDIGRSKHIRRRSTDLHKTIPSAWSRKAYKQNKGELVECDERSLLLANEQRSDDSASQYLFGEGRRASRPASDKGPQKTRVQDFVHKIEKMGKR